MSKRRIADASPPHVHGDCSYRPGVCGRHLPLWSGPTNMRQPGSQSKLLRVKTNVVPSHIKVLHGTILQVCVETCSHGKIGLCLGSIYPGRVQAHQGKGGKWPKYKWLGGAKDTQHGCQTTHIWWPPSAMHCSTHERQLACNPMPKTQTRCKKNATQRLPKRWQSTNWVDIATITHLNHDTSNIC